MVFPYFQILTSLMQRDHEARESLIHTGSLKSVLGLINPEVCSRVSLVFQSYSDPPFFHLIALVC